MSSNDTNRPGSRDSDSPIIRNNAGGSPQVTGAANEEHIVSGPSFFEKLFGTPLAKDNTKGTGDNTVSTTGDAASDAGTTAAASDAKDGAAPAASGDTTGSGAAKDDKKDEKKEERKPYSYREPEGPFKPHYPSTRAELLYDPPTPTVYLTPDAYKRMCLYVELAPKEVGWLGTISKREDGNFLIEEVFLVEQEVTPVETELSVEGSEKLVLELLEGGDPGLDKANKLHFWGHSHVRMGTSPSGTDESTMMRFSREGHEYYVRGIFNKLGRACFDVYYYKEGYRLLDVPWAVLDPATGKTLLEKGGGLGARKWWQGGPSNDRPYGYSSYPSWKERQEQEAKQRDEQSGLSEFLKKDDATAAPKKIDPLAISPELRAEVTAEYRAKVKERAPFVFRWFGKKDEKDGDNHDQNGQNGQGGPGSATETDGATANQATSGPDDVGGQVTDGELIPTGNDVRRTTSGGSSVPRVPNTSIKGAATDEKKGGFFAWLGSLFESSPTPAQPPTYPQGERPRKKCTPQNCNDATHPWSTNYRGPKPGSQNPNNRADRLPDDRQ
jgi:hypothetical protein